MQGDCHTYLGRSQWLRGGRQFADCLRRVGNIAGNNVKNSSKKCVWWWPTAERTAGLWLMSREPVGIDWAILQLNNPWEGGSELRPHNQMHRMRGQWTEKDGGGDRWCTFWSNDSTYTRRTKRSHVKVSMSAAWIETRKKYLSSVLGLLPLSQPAQFVS